MSSGAKDASFVFTKENFRNPSLPAGLRVVEVVNITLPGITYPLRIWGICGITYLLRIWGTSGGSNRWSSWRVRSHLSWSGCWWLRWWKWQWSPGTVKCWILKWKYKCKYDSKVQIQIQMITRYGRVLNSKEECSVERENFEIKPWPVQAIIRSLSYYHIF